MVKQCLWGQNYCSAPNTLCPYWIGTFCELDVYYGR